MSKNHFIVITSSSPPTRQHPERKQCNRNSGLRNIGRRKGVEHGLILWRNRGRLPGQRLPKIGSQVDEVGDADRSISIYITELPGSAAYRVEMRGQVDEVADADGAIQIQVADDGVFHQHFVAIQPSDAVERAVKR